MSLLTFPCSRRKGVEEYQAILASLDGLQDQHLDWQAWAIIVFDVCVCVFLFFRFPKVGRSLCGQFTHETMIWSTMVSGLKSL